ncbi:4Fe-4S dicluster domain-containing protein [Chloroflexota bacterium]
MARYGFVMDVTKCDGCYNCFLACRDEHYGNECHGYSAPQPLSGQFWMKIIERERGKHPKVKVAYTAVPCMHCDDAPCIKAGQEGAVYRRKDGIVIIDPQKAKGQKQIANSCPYRVIYWNEELGLPQKCTMCAHLLDAGWKEPRCSEVCPTDALMFGDLDDPNSEVAKLVASGKTEVLHPEYGLKENIAYIGLPKWFVAGAVAFGDTDACAEGATVTLSGNGETKTVKTDNYGDFEFEDLPKDTEYKVKIEAAGYKPVELTARTTTDVYFSEIILSR